MASLFGGWTVILVVVSIWDALGFRKQMLSQTDILDLTPEEINNKYGKDKEGIKEIINPLAIVDKRIKISCFGRLV